MRRKQEKSSPGTSSAKPTAVVPVAATTSEQAEQVFKWVVAGQSEHDIVEGVRSHFGADAKTLLIMAMKRLAQSSRFEEEVVIGWCVEATRELYRRMVEIGDFAGALRAVKQMREMAKDVHDGQAEAERRAGERRPKEAGAKAHGH